jgi:nucleoid-associated protein YgaU
MSVRRLALTSAVMGLLAVALAAVSPAPAELGTVLAAPQAAADAAGADTVVLAGCAVLTWVTWSWGALGLLLTAAAALPGAPGAVAAPVLRVVLPAGGRRAAAVALGIGLGLGGGPALAAPATSPPAAPESVAPAAVPDWPSAEPPVPAAVPDWPGRLPSGTHVVVRGDCLWEIAEHRLATEAGRPPTNREIAASVQAWWRANDAVIGPDPDLLLPGQVLRPPGTT